MGEENLADEKAVISQEEKDKAKRLEELEDLRLILATPQGMRFFCRFFEKAFLFQTTFTGNSLGNFKEGHRNLGLEVFDEICQAHKNRPDMIGQLLILTKNNGEDDHE